MIVRECWAFIGVCAQPVGLEFARCWDQARYRALEHSGTPTGEMPLFVWGETYSDATFTDAAQALYGSHGTSCSGASLTCSSRTGSPNRVCV